MKTLNKLLASLALTAAFYALWLLMDMNEWFAVFCFFLICYDAAGVYVKDGDSE